MAHRDFPIKEGHVDWLTGTCLYHKLKTPEAIDSMEREAKRLLEQCAFSGDKVTRARVLGFEGVKAQGVFYGRSNLGVMVRLSGHVAAEAWSKFYPFLSNVTRVDCAVTVELDEEAPGLSMVHWSEALKYQEKTAPKFKVVHIDGGKHGSTLLMGSRQSETYGRIYDKFLESKNEHYRKCWRYEVEFKGRAATDVAFRLHQSPEDSTVPIGIVSDWFRRRCVRPCFAAGAVSRYRVRRPITDVERRLTWLYTQVGPTVRELIDLGYQREIEEALFGSNAKELTVHDDARLKHKWATYERGGVWAERG